MQNNNDTITNKDFEFSKKYLSLPSTKKLLLTEELLMKKGLYLVGSVLTSKH